MHLAWHHFRFEIPQTWEVIAYKKSPEEGQLVLSDRHGETMSVFWKRMKSEPAVERGLVQLVKANTDQTLEDATIRERFSEVHGWQVFLPDNSTSPSFAARFLPDEKVLLSVVFSPYPGLDFRDWVAPALKSFQPNNGAERYWAAFGLDFNLPQEMKLAEVQALPAMQMMSFENRKKDTVTVHRYGMLSLILQDDDMATFFARRKGKKFFLHRDETFLKDGVREGTRLTYKTRSRSGLARFVGRARQGRVWLWRCDELQRLYCIDHCARQDDLQDNLFERVRCQ